MRIAVCDDEERFLNDIRGHIYRICNSMDIVVDCFSGGKSLIKAFEKKGYDVAFLDIEMPEMDGIVLARKLRELSRDLNIVFLTGHVEYALEGYEVNALRYLTKPVREDKLKEVLRYVSGKLTGSRRIKVRLDGEDTFIDVGDIIYLEAQNQYIMIYTRNGDFTWALGNAEGTELVFTGRGASEAIVARADLVTEMRLVKHYFKEKKLPARVGIEM